MTAVACTVSERPVWDRAGGRVFGKVALVTGAASGIGRATVLRLAAEGASVVATDIDTRGGEETACLARATGGRAMFIAHDVASEADWRDVIDTVVAAHGALHVLVNNAGIALAGDTFAMSHEDWRRQLAVNLDGVFLGVKHGVPLMSRSGGGSVVNVSSVAGLVGDPGLAGYSASKGGVRLFSKSVALECARARNGVRVNSLHPGVIDTPIWTTNARSQSRGGVAMTGLKRLWRRAVLRVAGRAGVPLGHAGTAADVANGILYLASDESRYVTGSELVIDGGLTAA
ncbi:SDR family oxidoreductase [Variovorax sp. GB1P17]|uniref:SDR family oxidoreductase n=1 Tax=Variovorax sp. GB1P17 TaxID=3443740 RepID=UPI003F466BEE